MFATPTKFMKFRSLTSYIKIKLYNLESIHPMNLNFNADINLW